MSFREKIFTWAQILSTLNLSDITPHFFLVAVFMFLTDELFYTNLYPSLVYDPFPHLTSHVTIQWIISYISQTES
jgi:hypothetical protein